MENDNISEITTNLENVSVASSKRLARPIYREQTAASDDDEMDNFIEETAEEKAPRPRWMPGDDLNSEQYFTPRPYIVALVKYIGAEFQTVFEPCCGDGHISKVLVEHGKNVIERDLYTTTELRTELHDYLDESIPIPEHDILITNPPFRKKFLFLEKAYKAGNV